MAPKYDILVAGEINPDLILTGDVEPAFGQVEQLIDAATLAVGSSSAIFACGAARLGLKTAFIGKCGDDLFGRFMLEAMQQREVNTRHVIIVPGQATGLSVILNRGVDRAIMTHPGLIPALKAEDIPDDLLRQAVRVYLATLLEHRDLAAVLLLEHRNLDPAHHAATSLEETTSSRKGEKPRRPRQNFLVARQRKDEFQFAGAAGS